MMNWRALMKIRPASEGVHTQNAQNTQNPPSRSNFADIADIADGLRPASAEHDSTVDIAVDVAGEKWDGLTHVERRALVKAVTLRLMRERGQVPEATWCARVDGLIIAWRRFSRVFSKASFQVSPRLLVQEFLALFQ